MKINHLLFLLTLLFTGMVYAQDRHDLRVSTIPDSLKTNAYAVIRYTDTEFTGKSLNSGVHSVKEAISVLDKKGEERAAFYYPGDQFRILKSFNARLYDANGILLKKFRLSDVQSSEYSTSLASDNKQYFFNCDVPSIPYTICYEYEVLWKDGILMYPTFYPIPGYNVSVEKGSMKLVLNETTDIAFRAFNMPVEPGLKTEKGISTRDWSVSNLMAYTYERMSPDLDSFIPYLYVRPISFVYDGVPGRITDWKDMGLWENKLLEGRDVLDEKIKAKVLELTENAPTDKEKVSILYDYLGKTTHYVSIQLGIGGYQPMLASEVYKTGFGDCKALSNYLKSMLSVIGIPSNYCCINYGNSDETLIPDFPNFSQMNHVVLQVPLPGDTLWLECTNPRNPFGFVHSGISGHESLVITDEGGYIQRLPDYPDSLNVEAYKADVVLKGDGSACANTIKRCHMMVYDSYSGFPYAKSDEQRDHLRESIHLPNATVTAFQFKENKAETPSIEMNYGWTTTTYGTKSGSRLFVPVNPFGENYDWMKKTKRVYDIEITRGYKDVDSIHIVLPEGFEVENIPSSVVISSKYGYFSSGISQTDSGILIVQVLSVPSGKYPVADYTAFVEYFNKISSIYQGKIILRKKQA